MNSKELVFVILSAAVALALIIAVAAGAMSGRPLSDNGREALVAIISAIVGAMGGYAAARGLNGKGG